MAVFRFGGMNNLADPAAIPLKSGQCVDIVNCWLNDEQMPTVREGYVRAEEGSFTSAWAKGGGAYVVRDGYLCWWNGSTLTPCLRNLDGALIQVVMGEFVDFVEVNDLTVCSDGSSIYALAGTDATLLNDGDEWAKAESGLEQWVQSHYPAGFDQLEANFAVDTFQLPVLPGRCLEFFNGALYLARDNFVYCTKVFDIEHMDIRFNVIAGFPDPVTMIAGVTGGLYVGTEGGTYFLGGDGPVQPDGSGGYSQRQIAPVGVLPHSQVRVAPALVPTVQAPGTVVLWSSPLGVWAGMPGGTALNLSQDKVYFPISGSTLPRCGAYFRAKDGVYHYIVSFEGNAWVMNTITLTFSRYTNYEFHELFALGGEFYGTSRFGIYRLAGPFDFLEEQFLEAQIYAYCLTPSVDFGVPQKMSLADLWLYGRATADMAFDLIPQETELATEIPLYVREGSVMQRIRGRPPRGLAGTCWQFRIKNVQGNWFQIKELEVVTLKHARR